MLWLLFGRSNGWGSDLSYTTQLQQNTNLIPLLTIKNYMYVLRNSDSTYMIRHCFINLAGNILLFVPDGWLLPKLWKWFRNFFHFFISCIGIIFLVEVLQLFTLLGRFDIDDILLNITGMVFGFLLWLLFSKKN